MSARFDNKRGLGTVYGVPALAGKVLSLEAGAKHLEIRGETTSGRLKLGLHTGTSFPNGQPALKQLPLRPV